jgi:hypothetical protein
MDNQAFVSFFPGILPDSRIGVRLSAICPVATYSQDGESYYCGVYSQQNITDDAEVYQTLYVCDGNGNVLSSRRILKQLILNEVLEYDRKENMNYTVRQPVKQIFLPAIDNSGCIYYGCVNYDKALLEVRTIPVTKYGVHTGSENAATDALLNAQRGYSLRIKPIQCLVSGGSVDIETGIMVAGKNGVRQRATIGDVASGGYYTSIERYPHPELSRRLTVLSGSVPPAAHRSRDSLAALSNANCPFSIILCKSAGDRIRTLYYGAGDVVLGARVLTVVDTSRIFVRVDLKDYAEVLEFTTDGSVKHRFVFNRQDFLDRRDIVAVNNTGTVIEEDYEQSPDGKSLCLWDEQPLH